MRAQEIIRQPPSGTVTILSSSSDDSSNEDNIESNKIKNAVEGVIDPTTISTRNSNDDDDDEEEDDDDDISSLDEDDDEEKLTLESKIKLGGILERPAYALLSGVLEDRSDEDEEVRVRVTPIELSIKRLPSVLGRKHKAMENKSNFISLGDVKAISRSHCTIYYRDLSGGRVGEYDDKNNVTDDEKELVYRESSLFPVKEEMEVNKEIVYDDKKDKLTAEGFFVIECKSKNSIFVDGQKVNFGRIALLRHKSAVSIGPYKLYFLLPMEEQKVNKKNALDRGDGVGENVAKRPKLSHDTQTTLKPTPASSDASKLTQPISAPTTTTQQPTKPAIPASKKQEAMTFLENLPTETLLARFYSAISSKQWERKHQMIGSALSFHAVRDAGRSKKLQTLSENGRVSRGAVMSWIIESKKYRQWVKSMLTKMEVKSYEGNIGKALNKNGYTRCGNTGRGVRWEIPKHLLDDACTDEEGEDTLQKEKSNNLPNSQEQKELTNINNNNNPNNEDVDRIFDGMDQHAQQQRINPPQHEVIAIGDDSSLSNT